MHTVILAIIITLRGPDLGQCSSCLYFVIGLDHQSTGIRLSFSNLLRPTGEKTRVSENVNIKRLPSGVQGRSPDRGSGDEVPQKLKNF